MCGASKRIAAAGARAECGRSSQALVFWSRRRWQSAPVTDEIIISQSTSRPRHLCVPRELDAGEIASKSGSGETTKEKKFARGGESATTTRWGRRGKKAPPPAPKTAPRLCCNCIIHKIDRTHRALYTFAPNRRRRRRLSIFLLHVLWEPQNNAAGKEAPSGAESTTHKS